MLDLTWHALPFSLSLSLLTHTHTHTYTLVCVAKYIDLLLLLLLLLLGFACVHGNRACNQHLHLAQYTHQPFIHFQLRSSNPINTTRINDGMRVHTLFHMHTHL
jgi:hypothetical protein